MDRQEHRSRYIAGLEKHQKHSALRSGKQTHRRGQIL